MARPPKNNADYFSHDNDMRNDDKIKAVRKKFWITWYWIWCMLLEKLCHADNFKLEYSELNLELWWWDFDIDSEELKWVIDYIIKLWLLINIDNKIYSSKLIDRFEWLIAKRIRDKDRLSELKQDKKEVIAGDNPQSKVKESKVKNILSKDKNIITKVIINNDFEIFDSDPIEIKLQKTLWKFVEFRKELKKPIKEASKQEFIKNLQKLGWNDIETMICILNQSIANGWQWIFPLKAQQESKRRTVWE